MQELTLVILAAGMASRFGSDKQIEAVGPNNEYLIDYSIHDAIKAGFDKIIIVIRPEHYEIFNNTVGKRINSKVNLIYAFQKLDDIPKDVKIPEGRTKLWGTAHALLAAAPFINGNFAIINADDFYGKKSFQVLADFLKNNTNPNEYISINYEIGKTISNNPVKRGICQVKDNYIVDLDECLVTLNKNKVHCQTLDNKKEFDINLNHPVMMNMFGFKRNYLDYLQEEFNKFIHNSLDLTCESLINKPLKELILNHQVKMFAKMSNEEYFGMTYKPDLKDVKQKILEKINNGVYKENLWEDLNENKTKN